MNARSRSTDEPPLIGARLRMCWQGVRTRIQQDLSAAGFSDLTAAHLAVFQHPTPRGMRITTLASRAGTSRQAITYLVEELIERGYLVRGPDPSDRRASLVELTERGEAAVAAIRSSVKGLEREWEAQVGTQRFAVFSATLAELTAALE
jgi:DNA-binding MarR family transcriptional regulator